jgi:2-dehydro-3-deoxygluconokinase
MQNKTIVAFGEIMLRLTPPDSILNSTQFSACYGGSESNVLVALSCLGNSTRYLTKLPANDLGRSAVMHLQKYGVDCSRIIMDGSNMGMYFLETGFATRQTKVIYARKQAEVTTLKAGDMDYDRVFADCALFHISGISFALSASVQELCFRLLEEAKKRNIPVSFDFNYRGKLWTTQQAAPVYRKIISYVDTVFCSRLDLTAFLGLEEADFFAAYPNVKQLVVRERDILSVDTHAIRAAVYTSDGCVAETQRELKVLERIGGGDAFAAGYLHGQLHFDGDLRRTLNFAAESFALKHTIRGDVLAATAEEIGMSGLKDVKR